MNERMQQLLLPALLAAKGYADIPITGVSMHPTLKQGDIVTVIPSDTYEIGDILIYPYKDEGLLIHRLIRKDGRYFCKGDNSLRTEDLAACDIIGKATHINNTPIAEWPRWKTSLSDRVGREFHHLRYHRENTQQSAVYKAYAELILCSKETINMYIKNTSLDYIQTDDTSLAVFDPASGNTYFFDSIGIDILTLLEQPIELEKLIAELCKIYLAKPDEIQTDVEEFLAYTVSKGIVTIV